MKTTLFGIAAALALTSMSAAYAQDPSVQIKPTRGVLVMAEDFRDFQNTYQLTNGDLIAFSARMNHFYTQLGDGERVRIYPVARNVFVTESGARIEFRDEGDTVGIANFEKLSLAAKLPANTMMMASARR